MASCPPTCVSRRLMSPEAVDRGQATRQTPCEPNKSGDHHNPQSRRLGVRIKRRRTTPTFSSAELTACPVPTRHPQHATQGAVERPASKGKSASFDATLDHPFRCVFCLRRAGNEAETCTFPPALSAEILYGGRRAGASSLTKPPDRGRGRQTPHPRAVHKAPPVLYVNCARGDATGCRRLHLRRAAACWATTTRPAIRIPTARGAFLPNHVANAPVRDGARLNNSGSGAETRNAATSRFLIH